MRRNDFHLIETMRLGEGDIAMLDLHLDRLEKSAAHFGISFDRAAAQTQIAEVLTGLPEGEPRQVRLTLGADGSNQITTHLLTSWPEEVRCTLCELPYIEDKDILHHKTSRRQAYDAAWQDARKEGFDEVLFVNLDGWVTEGSRTNLFIGKDNAYYTPPVACGLLPGVYRRHLLETLPNAHEQKLTPGDLYSADAAFVCNALRGRIKIKLDENETFRRDYR